MDIICLYHRIRSFYVECVCVWTYVCRQVCGLCVHVVARDQHRVSPSSLSSSGFRTLVPGCPGSVSGGLPPVVWVSGGPSHSWPLPQVVSHLHPSTSCGQDRQWVEGFVVGLVSQSLHWKPCRFWDWITLSLGLTDLARFLPSLSRPLYLFYCIYHTLFLTFCFFRWIDKILPKTLLKILSYPCSHTYTTFPLGALPTVIHCRLSPLLQSVRNVSLCQVSGYYLQLSSDLQW